MTMTSSPSKQFTIAILSALALGGAAALAPRLFRTAPTTQAQIIPSIQTPLESSEPLPEKAQIPQKSLAEAPQSQIEE
ncbi:hypothetical protein, partial [Okeania sp. SIO1I7]|uniref:hypothetical protein n=1 Tax=Okeania sp. SIO1I7 TaxID=2607772 RepID=UPI0013FB03B1